MILEEALERAQMAMASGGWTQAKAEFEAVLAHEENVAAITGLADALWWLGDAAGCLSLMEKAYSIHRDAGSPMEAAMAALWLAGIHLKSLGNRSACSGWIATAQRLVDDAGLDMMAGWMCWAHSVESTDPAVARDRAEESVALARAMGDRDLELCGLSELGKAYVGLGDSDRGMRLIDEAMAAAISEQARSLDTVVATCCSMMGACDQAADLGRVAEWCRAADKFMQTYGSPFLYADCRLRYGSVLLATGHWGDAERELRSAAAATTSDTDYYAKALGKLAELRIRQGRLEEAEAIADEISDQHAALLPKAALHHKRNELDAAARLLARHLDSPESEPLDQAEALDLLTVCHLSAGRTDAARLAAGRLATLAENSFNRVQAHSGFAAGRVALADGSDDAERLLEEAMQLFSTCNLPFETAQVRLALARALTGNQQVAIAEAQGAFSTFERLGAVADADEAAQLIRSWGGAARTGPKDFGALTKREQEVLRLVGAGLSNPEIAERLYLSRKTVSHHVSNVLSKLGLRNRAEAAVQAARHLLEG